jgi:hypothetical protein
MTSFFARQQGTTLNFGSKFQSVASSLRPLLGYHPNFEEFASVLEKRMPYRFSTEIGDTTRERDMLAMISGGNHKSAQDNPEQVRRLLTKDVVHGFSMVLPIELVPLIPKAMVQPTGLAQQRVLDEKGQRNDQVPNDTEPQLHRDGQGRAAFSQQQNRHDGLSRNDLWMVPATHPSLYCGALLGVTGDRDIYIQVRL